MTQTKKSFMLAGSIIAIVEASIMILTAIILFSYIGIIDEEFILAAIEAGEEIPTADEMSMIINLTQIIVGVMGGYILAMSISMLVFAIIVLKQTSKGVSKKGSIITLLVFSVLNANIISAAFMIVALCLKDKTPEQIVEENMNQSKMQ